MKFVTVFLATTATVVRAGSVGFMHRCVITDFAINQGAQTALLSTACVKGDLEHKREHTLHAACATIDMNKCIAEINNAPTPSPNGGFVKDCGNWCPFEKEMGRMVCVCIDNPEISIGGAVDFNRVVDVNANGDLQCYGVTALAHDCDWPF